MIIPKRHIISFFDINIFYLTDALTEILAGTYLLACVIEHFYAKYRDV
jgi:hypothetical protein